MIEFRCNSYNKKDRTPIVSDLEIMDYAEAVIGDYKKSLLKDPAAINPEHFLESYLGATLDYQDIYYEEDQGAIAGATVFNDEKVLIFDRENMCVRPIDVEANTIIIDNSTVEEGKEAFALFTELHEGGHFCIHPCVYRRTPGQLSLFESHDRGEHIVKCKRSSLENRKGRLVTEEDFREHQANVFAATTAMPRPTFVPAAKEYIRKVGIGEKNGLIVIPDEFDWAYELGKYDVICPLTNLFGASRTATEIHMKRLGLIVTETQYMDQYRQVSVVF